MLDSISLKSWPLAVSLTWGGHTNKSYPSRPIAKKMGSLPDSTLGAPYWQHEELCKSSLYDFGTSERHTLLENKSSQNPESNIWKWQRLRLQPADAQSFKNWPALHKQHDWSTNPVKDLKLLLPWTLWQMVLFDISERTFQTPGDPLSQETSSEATIKRQTALEWYKYASNLILRGQH